MRVSFWTSTTLLPGDGMERRARETHATHKAAQIVLLRIRIVCFFILSADRRASNLP